MKFNNHYERLVPGKYFDTLWVALPDSSLLFLKEALSPIRSWCEWCIGVDDGNKPNTIPHITLRYLGYDSIELREQILNNIDGFRDVIQNHMPLELHVSELFIWQSPPETPTPQARINWKIENHSNLTKIHHQLLEIQGFSFFQDLEGDNFTPHITLGKVNLEKTESLKNIQNYFGSISMKKFTIYLENFQINLASIVEKDNIRISLLE